MLVIFSVVFLIMPLPVQLTARASTSPWPSRLRVSGHALMLMWRYAQTQLVRHVGLQNSGLGGGINDTSAAALDSKAASEFAIPNNPMAEHTTTNIGEGVALDPSPWEGIFCRERGDSGPPLGQINGTSVATLNPKAALGLAIRNK